MRANTGRPSRFDYDPSALGQSFVQGITDAGAGVADATMGFNKLRAEIGKRKAEALADIEDYEFQLAGAESAFADEALELENRINGIGEDAYDFRKITDVKRFETDVNDFNERLNEAGEIDKAIVQKRDDLEARRQMYVNSNKNLDNIPTEKVEGVGDMYDGHVLDGSYDLTMENYNFLSTGRLQKMSDGRYGILDDSGQVMQAFDSVEDYMSAVNDTVKADLRPSPADSGQEIVQDNGWGTLYDDEMKAESAFLQYVLDNEQLAIRRKLEKAGNPAGTYIRVEDGQDVIKRHPNSAGGATSMTDAQKELLDEMMQEWRDEQKRKEKLDAKGNETRKGSGGDLLVRQTQLEPAIVTEATDGGGVLLVGEPGELASGGSIGPSATMALDDKITMSVSLQTETGEQLPIRFVEVVKIGYDGSGPFGVGTYEIDGVLQSVRIPLPAEAGGEAMGDLYANLVQEYDMSSQSYDNLINKLAVDWANGYGPNSGGQ